MIDYVDRLLVHWAQEFSVRDRGVGLGYSGGWRVQAIADLTRGRLVDRRSEEDKRAGRPVRHETARGVATRPTAARTGVGRVAERVNEAVEQLPALLNRVVSVHYLENPGLSVVEKAIILGCSARSFHNYIHRSHEQISVMLPDSYVRWTLKYSQAVNK